MEWESASCGFSSPSTAQVFLLFKSVFCPTNSLPRADKGTFSDSQPKSYHKNVTTAKLPHRCSAVCNSTLLTCSLLACYTKLSMSYHPPTMRSMFHSVCPPGVDNDLGPLIRSPCRNGNDFTLVFEDLALTIVPSAILTLATLGRTPYLLRQSKKTQSTSTTVIYQYIKIVRSRHLVFFFLELNIAMRITANFPTARYMYSGFPPSSPHVAMDIT